MALPQGSCITRKRGVYYYRRRLPGSDRKEVAVSLLTRHYRQAEYRAARLNVLFARIIPYMHDRTKIAAILRQHLQEQIARDEAEWLRAPTGNPAYAVWADEGEGAAQADIQATESWLSEALGDAQRRDIAGYEEGADDIIRRHGLTNEDRPEIAFGLIQARIKMLEARLKRLRNGGPEMIPPAPVPLNELPSALPPSPAGPPLSALLPDFLTFMSEHEGWRGQTLAQNHTTYRMFIDHCGDLPIQSYQKADLTSFYDILRRLPALYAKKAEWRDLPLREIAQRTQDEDIERVTMKTVKRHFSALAGC